MQDGANAPKNVMCKSCVRKNKMKRGLIAASMLLLIILCVTTCYFRVQNNATVGFNGVVNIEDSVNVIIEEPTEKFILEMAIAQSSPVIAGLAIDNIESFKRVLAKNIQNAEQNDNGNIDIPNICALFSISSSNVTPEVRALLLEYSKIYMQTNKQAVILVEGYACDLGSKEFNDLISKQRAESVKNVFVLLGVPESNIEVMWHGKLKNKDFSYPNIKDYRRAIISIKDTIQ